MSYAVGLVFVVNTDPPVLTFHEWGRLQVTETKTDPIDDRRIATKWVHLTKCGKELQAMSSARLRRDHAEKIGRPCRKCFPAVSPPADT